MLKLRVNVEPVKRQHLKIVKLTQTICREKPTNCLRVFGHVVGFALKWLSVTVPIQDEDRKLTQVFIFTLLCGCSKGFLKAFIKPFEAPHRSVKIEI